MDKVCIKIFLNKFRKLLFKSHIHKLIQKLTFIKAPLMANLRDKLKLFCGIYLNSISLFQLHFCAEFLLFEITFILVNCLIPFGMLKKSYMPQVGCHTIHYQRDHYQLFIVIYPRVVLNYFHLILKLIIFLMRS